MSTCVFLSFCGVSAMFMQIWNTVRKVSFVSFGSQLWLPRVPIGFLFQGLEVPIGFGKEVFVDWSSEDDVIFLSEEKMKKIRKKEEKLIWEIKKEAKKRSKKKSPKKKGSDKRGRSKKKRQNKDQKEKDPKKTIKAKKKEEPKKRAKTVKEMPESWPADTELTEGRPWQG